MYYPVTSALICSTMALILSHISTAYADRLNEIDKDTIKISSIGDWGDQDVVKSKVSKWVTENAVDGVFMLGDNFYPIGVKNVDDSQFESLFEKGFRDIEPAKKDDKEKKRDYYVIAGNHDYYGNVTAELEYAKKQKHWIYPSLYYSKLLVSESSKVKVFIVATDSWGLNGGDTMLNYYPDTGKTFIKSFDILDEKVKNGDIPEVVAHLLKSKYPVESKRLRDVKRSDEVQFKWIEKELSSDVAQSADWLIVLGHFPIHSCSVNEHGDTKYLVERLRPILEKYQVDAYLSGHDHILQHNKVGNINYFGSGAGGKKHDQVNKNYNGYIASTIDAFGYMEHEFTKSYFRTTLYASINGEKTKTHYYEVSKEEITSEVQ